MYTERPFATLDVNLENLELVVLQLLAHIRNLMAWLDHGPDIG